MDEEIKKARYSREVEQSLRQFLNHDGPKGSKEAYREGWDRIFGAKKEPEEIPVERLTTQRASIPPPLKPPLPTCPACRGSGRLWGFDNPPAPTREYDCYCRRRE